MLARTRFIVISLLASFALLPGCDSSEKVTDPDAQLSLRFQAESNQVRSVRVLLRKDEVKIAEWQGRPGEICNFDLTFADTLETLAIAYDEAGHILESAQWYLAPAITGAISIALKPLPSHDAFPMPERKPGFAFALPSLWFKDYDGPTDENGIPLNDHVWNVPGPVYHPLFVATIAMGKHAAYVNGEGDHYRDEFFLLVNWLRDVAQRDGNIAYWPYSFAYSWVYLDYQPPWVSGLAQGEIIAALLRAYDLSGEPEYLELANQGIMAFHRLVDEPWGMAAIDCLGYHTLEEYPGQPCNHVLNGMVLALFGVLDHYLVTGDPHSETLYRRHIRYLADRIHVYDAGNWSLYDTYRKPGDPGTPVSEAYHNLHIKLLDILYEQTGLVVFQEYADLFRSYQ